MSSQLRHGSHQLNRHRTNIALIVRYFATPPFGGRSSKTIFNHRQLPSISKSYRVAALKSGRTAKQNCAANGLARLPQAGARHWLNNQVHSTCCWSKTNILANDKIQVLVRFRQTCTASLDVGASRQRSAAPSSDRSESMAEGTSAQHSQVG